MHESVHSNSPECSEHDRTQRSEKTPMPVVLGSFRSPNVPSIVRCLLELQVVPQSHGCCFSSSTFQLGLLGLLHRMKIPSGLTCHSTSERYVVLEFTRHVKAYAPSFLKLSSFMNALYRQKTALSLSTHTHTGSYTAYIDSYPVNQLTYEVC